eukprot:318022-Rhodomonas_salina.3
MKLTVEQVVHLKDEWGSTVLHYAAHGGHAGVCACVRACVRTYLCIRCSAHGEFLVIARFSA